MLRFFLLLAVASPLAAQLPFYTDDPAVTERGKLHFEFFNEFDALQHPQFPDLRQNTANYKINFGLPFNLELDLDAPYLAIFRALGTPDAAGLGDTDLGIKWNFHKEAPGSRAPALGASLYIEFPTGDTRKQLSSGLTDYWLNFMTQKSLSDKTRVNGNLGYLFAGNTSTGVIGIETTRGHVVTGGLSILHDFSPRLTLGGEIYGGITSNADLGKSQFQGLLGGTYTIRNGLAVSFALLGGKYIASPRIGGQIGFSVDFPDVVRPAAAPPASIH
ncbi:MAG: transporter [Acidobacteriia bacterium]|nr:transporter [Terriglobia bacterium]